MAVSVKCFLCITFIMKSIKYGFSWWVYWVGFVVAVLWWGLCGLVFLDGLTARSVRGLGCYTWGRYWWGYGAGGVGFYILFIKSQAVGLASRQGLAHI